MRLRASIPPWVAILLVAAVVVVAGSVLYRAVAGPGPIEMSDAQRRKVEQALGIPEGKGPRGPARP